MTSHGNLFSLYTPSPENVKIKIADSNFSAVAGIGTIHITPNITLNSVLHVPKLACNLLSVSKITTHLNCLAQFSCHACLFQDDSGKEIGRAKENEGLYYFETDFGVIKTISNC